jgi:hypothetical protein
MSYKEDKFYFDFNEHKWCLNSCLAESAQQEIDANNFKK